VSFGLFLAGITARIDIVLLKSTLTLSEVGVYGFFLKFVIPVTMLSSTLVTFVSPLINRKDFSIVIFVKEKLSRKLFYFILLFLVLYMFFGVYVITHFLRRELVSYSYIGSLLILFSSASIIMNPISMYGYNFGFDKYYPFINVLQLLVFYIIYTFLVGKFGLIMAVLSYGSSFVIGGLFLFVLFKNKYDFKIW
jgi:O-antigen/teichoic acid export membrane protein